MSLLSLLEMPAHCTGQDMHTTMDGAADGRNLLALGHGIPQMRGKDEESQEMMAVRPCWAAPRSPGLSDLS